MPKSIIIIGAGVAGLCSGIYGQMNGYQTHIYEQHKIPGGLLTAFRRKGYLVDVCIHWLCGSGPGIHLHRYWNEIGLLEGKQFLQFDQYAVFHGKDGRAVHFYCDPDRMEQHLLELSPKDAGVIKDLVESIRLGIRFKTPEKLQYEASSLEWMKTIFSMMPIVGGIQKYTKMTVGDLADRFQEPLIRDALKSIWEPDFSVFYMISAMLGYMHKQQAGYPVGGSLPIALWLEKRYKQLGGQVSYQTRVEKILIEDGRAVGIQFADGTRQMGDIVLSAADGHTTLYKLLGEKYISDAARVRYESWKPFPSLLFLSLGVKRTFPDIPFSVEGNVFELKKPAVIAGEERTWIGLRVNNHDSSFAPPGKTVLTSTLYTSYDHWESLRSQPEAYKAEKECIAREFIAALEQIWPGIAGDIEMYDVATPSTFVRITGNWKGSITGWKLTPEQAVANIPKDLPGLENFWMIGQWVGPGGGLPVGLSTAREVIWQQCKKDKKKFLADTNH